MNQITPRSISELIPYVNNARTHSDEQVAMIAASLREFGWTNPILIDSEGGVIAGHGRLLAARKILEVGASIPDWPNTSEVPVLELSHMTEQQKRAYVIADNKLAERAGWNIELLSLELSQLTDMGFNMDVLGFDTVDLESLIGASNFSIDSTEPSTSSSVEIDTDQFEMGHRCPRCGFEFNDKT